jgi:hypothetical protein
MLNKVFSAVAGERRSYPARDRILAYYAPIGLVLLPGVWVVLVIAGYTLMYWGTGVNPLREAFIISGSSLLTLGFDRPSGLPQVVLAFTEAAIGLGLIALLISYLPTFYNAFARREALVGLLAGRAGTPPWTGRLLARYSEIGALKTIDAELFPRWEQWFAEVEESHTSNPALVFFRSPHPDRNWVTAAGCVLDTASIVVSTVDRPRNGDTELTIRTGFLCLRRIADYYGITYDPDPRPDDPISVTRREYDLLLVEMTAAGIPMKADIEQAWRDFVGWRVNYDTVLVALAGMVRAPHARWSSDRPPIPFRPRILRPSPLKPVPEQS